MDCINRTSISSQWREPGTAPALQRPRCLVPGSQGGYKGEYDIETARKLIQRYNSRLASTHLKVRFSARRLRKAKYGTCEAMTMEFIHKWLTIKKEGQASDYAVDCLRESAWFERSNEHFRTTQQVFATLRPETGWVKLLVALIRYLLFLSLHSETLLEEHVEALTAPYPLMERGGKVFDSTDSRQESPDIDALSDGVYLVYVWEASALRLGLGMRHAASLIKEGDNTFFYDPNDGLHLVSQGFCKKLRVKLQSRYRVAHLDLFRITLGDPATAA